MTTIIPNSHKDSTSLLKRPKKEVTNMINKAEKVSSGIHKISIDGGQVLKTNLGKEGTLGSTNSSSKNVDHMNTTIKSTKSTRENSSGNRRNTSNIKGDNSNSSKILKMLIMKL